MTHVTKTPSLFGGSSNITYTAKFDGKDDEILGTGLDTVSLKRWMRIPSSAPAKRAAR